MTRRVVSGISELYTPFTRVTDVAMVIDGDSVAWVGHVRDLPAEYLHVPVDDLGGRGVLPGLVDSHTHL
ncbi:MAG TPA: hypothetical protein VFN03_06965, partial [Trueperaceae bacterium]|nr:hypothetical protein [Trueperaceae bacterium]